MKTVSAAEANRHFSKPLRDVQAGETVLVTSRGRPVAQIQPPDRTLAEREKAKQELLEYLRSQPTRNLNITWTRDDRPSFAGGDRRIVRSIGGALRVNVFGLLAVELAASHPYDRVDRSVQWQVGIRQGF